MENTSGQGKSALVPPEVDRWNWGAFLLNWIWGIGNNTFIALLMFVPFVNFVMPFVLGAKGSSWAWRNKRWQSVEDFKRVQRKWALWSLIVFAAVIALFVGMFFVIMASMKGSDAYQLGVSRLQSNSDAIAVLGAPVSTGFPMGNIEVSGPSGKAAFSFGVEGSKAKGTVYLHATKELGTWKMNRIELEVEGQKSRIDLNTSGQAPPDAAKPVAQPKAAPETPSSAAAKSEPANSTVDTKPAVAPATAMPATKEATKEASVKAALPAVASDQRQPVAVQPTPKSTSAAMPERAARTSPRRLAPDADARKCLEFADNTAIARCAEAYR